MPLQILASENRYSVSLLTYSPAEELYSAFGHSALRIIDHKTNTDYVYNWGIFDFDTPGFYWKFIKGRLPYSLARIPADYAIDIASIENRSVLESKLNLTEDESMLLISFVEENLLPENSTYLYDFFYDNCATKIIEMVDSASQGRYQWSINNYSPLSLKKFTHAYLIEYPWAKLGMDLVMGYNAQKIASEINTAYLPDFLHQLFREAEDTKSGSALMLTEKYILVPPLLTKKKIVVYPEIIFITLLLITLALNLFAVVNSRIRNVWRFLILGIPAISGIILLLFWGISDHNIYAWNHSILWANPLLLIGLNKNIGNNSLFKWLIALLFFTGLVLSFLFDQSLAIGLIIITIGIQALNLEKTSAG